MVANIKSGSSPGGALHYNKEKVDKGEAEVSLFQKMLNPYDRNGRLDVDACMESFMPYLQANRRTNNTVFHASLNPSPEDRLRVLGVFPYDFFGLMIIFSILRICLDGASCR